VHDPPNDQDYQELRDNASGEVPPVVPCAENAVFRPVFGPDLARVVDAWDCLPAAIRMAILALVQAATGDASA
jgi:hypothetical protein